jgi:hypothetical protein
MIDNAPVTLAGTRHYTLILLKSRMPGRAAAAQLAAFFRVKAEETRGPGPE